MRSPRNAAALLWLGAGIIGCGSFGAALSATEEHSSGATGLVVGSLAGGSAWDHALSVPVLYKNPANPLLQELSLVGQLQTQYAIGSDDGGNFGTRDMPDTQTWGNIEVRRMRLGMKGTLFGKLSFLYLADLYPDLTPEIYKRAPEMYVTWAGSDLLNISAGKTELKFNREQEYSSKEFLPFERTALGNMFYGGELTGAWICGKGVAGGGLYYLGAFSNDRMDEFSHFEGGAVILGKIGWNYTASTSWDLAEVKLQYLHNTDPGYAESAACLVSPLYANCISISNQIAEGPFGLTTEFLWGDGVKGRPDVCGIMAMPTYSFSSKLQLVSTIELAGSRDANGVILPTRYEALAPGVGDKAGDLYFSGFAGLNYYIHSHNLKLMSGVKYSYLDGGSGGGDFNGWTWLSGVRMAF